MIPPIERQARREITIFILCFKLLWLLIEENTKELNSNFNAHRVERLTQFHQ